MQKPALPPFKPRAPWYGGDLQTLRNYLRPVKAGLEAWPGRRLKLAVGDGSGEHLSALLHRPVFPPAGPGATPLVVLIHGLTGCEASSYMMASANSLLSHGYPVLRLNLRGAGPSRSWCRAQYHAGRSEDLHGALNDLSGMAPEIVGRGVCLVGYSLGGNMLVKFMAEHAGGISAGIPVLGAVAVSAPLDLKASQERLMAPRNRLYHRYLIERMRADYLTGPAGTDEAERVRVRSVATIYDFDEEITAPRNGFAGAEHYYAANSGRNFLAKVAVPMLLIKALDDPWIPSEAYLAFDWENYPNIEALLPRSGGHVGFHGRDSDIPWHDRVILRFLKTRATGRAKQVQGAQAGKN
jgi:predicted alpha/beta-fold hydrolase